jgi:hypothetical protein
MATITVEVEKCSIEGCMKPATAKGLCASHYRRLVLHGDPLHTARQFHGVPTKVIGISLPVALIEAATLEIVPESTDRAVTIIARKLVESSWGKKCLAEAGVDMKNAGAVIVARKPADESKPKKAKKAKKAKTEVVDEAPAAQ